MKIIPSVINKKVILAIRRHEKVRERIILTLEDKQICLEFSRVEQSVARNDEDTCRHDECIPGSIGLEYGTVWQEGLSVKTLRFHGVVEANPRG